MQVPGNLMAHGCSFFSYQGYGNNAWDTATALEHILGLPKVIPTIKERSCSCYTERGFHYEVHVDDFSLIMYLREGMDLKKKKKTDVSIDTEVSASDQRDLGPSAHSVNLAGCVKMRRNIKSLSNTEWVTQAVSLPLTSWDTAGHEPLSLRKGGHWSQWWFPALQTFDEGQIPAPLARVEIFPDEELSNSTF